MSNKDLLRKISWLETRLDQIETERSHLNTMLVDCGFPQGIGSLKATIQELLDESDGHRFLPPEECF